MPCPVRHDILAAVAEARIDDGREAREGVDDRQYTDPAAGRQLVMNEIHSPDVVGMSGLRAVFPELCPHPSLWGLFGGMMPSEVKRMGQLEEENNRLKEIVADLTLDKAMLQDVIKRKL